MSEPVIWTVLITASRWLTDAPAVHAVLDAELAAHGRILLRHGACPTGGDLFAHEWAIQRPGVVDEDPMPADWDRPCDENCRHGPRYRDGERYCAVAGFIRNQEMVDKGADICHGFPQGKSPGTKDCMRRARRAHIRVIKHEEPAWLGR